MVREAGFEVERATYVNISFFAPILLGRLLMRATGLRPESENNITIGFSERSAWENFLEPRVLRCAIEFSFRSFDHLRSAES